METGGLWNLNKNKKINGDVRVLVDFRQLYAKNTISSSKQKCKSWKAFILWFELGYYHIPLSQSSMQLCTMIVPWAKYQYLHLPIGVKNSPNTFQAVMFDLLRDLAFTSTYIDDILVVSAGTLRTSF
jgi:hypothetical protein